MTPDCSENGRSNKNIIVVCQSPEFCQPESKRIAALPFCVSPMARAAGGGMCVDPRFTRWALTGGLWLTEGLQEAIVPARSGGSARFSEPGAWIRRPVWNHDLLSVVCRRLNESRKLKGLGLPVDEGEQWHARSSA